MGECQEKAEESDAKPGVGGEKTVRGSGRSERTATVNGNQKSADLDWVAKKPDIARRKVKGKGSMASLRNEDYPQKRGE